MNPHARVQRTAARFSPVFWTALVIASAHIIIIGMFPPALAERALSGWMQLASAVLALAACYQARQRSCELSRMIWCSLIASIGLWAVSQALYLFNAFYLHSEDLNPNILLLFFFVSMFPLSISVFLTRQHGGHVPRWLAWFDVAQVVGMLLAGCLLNFSLTYGTRGTQQVETRLLTLHVRNLLLAVALLARGLGARGRLRALYAPIVFAFSFFTLSSWVGNQATEFWGASVGGWCDLCWSLPFIFFAIAAAQWQRRPARVTQPMIPVPAPSVTKIKQTLCPALCSLFVVALSLMGLKSQRTIAVSLIFGSLLCYFTRSSLAQQHRERLLTKARTTLNSAKRLTGYLPICASCKNVRSASGNWQQLEGYIRQHSEAEFTHGICPPCAEKLYPEHLAGSTGS